MKKKEIFLASFLLAILALLSAYFSYLTNTHTKKELNKMNEKTTFSVIENTPLFKKEYEKQYEQIVLREESHFLAEVNRFLDLNYEPEEINQIYAFLRRANIEKLLDSEKRNVKEYYSISNFDVDKIHRYEEYQRTHNCNLKEAVLKVNIGLDHDFYTQIEEIENKSDFTVLVNKYHSLGEYEPTDLKPLSYDAKYQLREQARNAFEELVSAAKLENVSIRPYSAYRSYEYQTSLYDKYVARDGKDVADTYSARPGHSEHQTGLAVDVWSEGFHEITKTDAKWLEKNSYKYGFIVRYTKENKNITGYIEEPWHLRYLGRDIALDVYEKKIAYDEYYDLYLK